MFLTWWISGVIVLISSILILTAKDWLNGILLSIVGVFFLFYPLIVMVSSLHTNIRQTNCVDNILFKEDSMQVITTMFDEEVANIQKKYTELTKLVETKNYFYIYSEKQNAWIVDKSLLNEEEKDFIRNNINNNLSTIKK